MTVCDALLNIKHEYAITQHSHHPPPLYLLTYAWHVLTDQRRVFNREINTNGPLSDFIFKVTGQSRSTVVSQPFTSAARRVAQSHITGTLSRIRQCRASGCREEMGGETKTFVSNSVLDQTSSQLPEQTVSIIQNWWNKAHLAASNIAFTRTCILYIRPNQPRTCEHTTAADGKVRQKAYVHSSPWYETSCYIMKLNIVTLEDVC